MGRRRAGPGRCCWWCHKLGFGAGQALPLLLCVLALLGITGGTLYQKRFVPQFDLRTGQVVQFAACWP